MFAEKAETVYFGYNRWQSHSRAFKKFLLTNLNKVLTPFLLIHIYAIFWWNDIRSQSLSR